MANSGRNGGFDTLDEFVCQAVPATGSPTGNPARPGRSEGLVGCVEVVFDSRPGSASQPTPDDALLSEVARLSHGLAAYIATSGDPARTAASARQLLLAELDSIEKAVTGR